MTTKDLEERANMASARANLDEQSGMVPESGTTDSEAFNMDPSLQERAQMMEARENLDIQSGMSAPTDFEYIGPEPKIEEKDAYFTPKVPEDYVNTGSIKTRGQKAALEVKVPIAAEVAGTGISPEVLNMSIANDDTESVFRAIHSSAEGGYNRAKQTILGEYFKNDFSAVSEEELNRVAEFYQKPLFTDAEQATDFMYGFGLINAMASDRDGNNPDFPNEINGAASIISMQELVKRKIQKVEDNEAFYNRRAPVDMEAEGFSADILSANYWFNSGAYWKDNWVLRLIPFLRPATDIVQAAYGVTQSEAFGDAASLFSVTPNYFTAEEDAPLANQILGDWDAIIQNIMVLPPDEREAAIDAKLDEIAEGVPFQPYGIQKLFLERVNTMSDTEAGLEAAMAAFDLGTGIIAGTAFKGAKAGVKAGATAAKKGSLSTRTALNKATTLGFRPKATLQPEHIVETIADSDTLIETAAADIMTRGANTLETRYSLQTTTGNMRAWFEPDGNLSSEPIRRVLEELDDDVSFREIIRASVGTIDRFDPSNPQHVKDIITRTRKQMELEGTPWLKQAVAVEPRIPPSLIFDHNTNTFDVSFVMGKMDGTGFTQESHAKAFITRELPEGMDSSIELVNGQYYVRVNRKAVEREGVYGVEDIDLAPDQRLNFDGSDTWWARTKAVFRKGAGSSLRMSDASRADRLKLQGLESNNIELIRQHHIKRVEGISKTARKEVLEFLEKDRVHEEVVEYAPGQFTRVQGRYAQNINEFKQRFMQMHNKQPTADHVKGYFSYVLMNDQEYALRNLNAYSFKNQIGLRIYDVQLGTNKIDNIEGRIEKDIEWNNPGEAGIVVLGETPEYLRTKTYGDATREVIQGKLKEGYKVVRLSPEGTRRVLEEDTIREVVGGDTLHYMLVKDELVSRPLPFQQIPYKAGGHIKYSDGVMVSIPRLKKINRNGVEMIKVDGDLSLLHFRSRNKAQIATEALQRGIDVKRNGGTRLEIEEALKDVWGDMAGPLSKTVDEQEVPEFLEATAKGMGEDIVERLKLNEKIGEDRLINPKNDSYNLYSGMDQEFMQARNPIIGTAKNVGTSQNPVFSREAPALVDYNKTAMGALENVVNGIATQDFKFKEALAFHKQFGHLLKTSKRDLQANPVLHVISPDWKDNVSNWSELQAAKHAQKSLAMFLNTPTKEAQWLRTFKERFLDDVVRSVPSAKIQNILDEKLLATTSDPVRFMRGFAFHSSLGLFNPKQFMLQSSAYASIAAIAGFKAAGKGLSAFSMARMSMLTKNPKVLKAIATKKGWGWDAEQFAEAWDALQSTGFHRVGGEAALRLDTEGPKVVQSKWGKFLDAGAFFFNEGERLPRMAGYFAAYSELAARKGKTTGALNLTAKERDWLLRRADDLTYNMTRVGSAEWQRGLTSVPTQFITYQTRLMDLMLGVQLTKMEKLRLMAMHSVLYGAVPGTAGTALGLLPWQEMLQQELVEKGVNDEVQQNAILNAIVNGVPAAVLKEVTGEEYDVTASFGPGGLSQFWDFVMGDTPPVEFFAGPGGQEFKQFWERGAQVRAVGKKLLGFEPVPPEEIVQAIGMQLTGISTVGNSYELFKALSLGSRESVSNYLMSNDPADSTVEAIMKFLTGVRRAKDSDAFRYAKAIKDFEDEQNKAVTKAADWYVRAVKTNDDKLRDYYMAQHYGVIELNNLDGTGRVGDVHRQAHSRLNVGMDRSVMDKYFGLDEERQIEGAQQSIREMNEFENRNGAQ